MEGECKLSNYKLEVIPKPAEGSASVLIWGGAKSNHSIITGQGADSYLCGVCSNVICKNVDRGQIINLVFSCPNCGSYSKIKGT